MNILKNIIERLNQKLDASNIFGAIYGLAEPAPDNPKQFFVYEGSGQGKPVTDYDKTQGTAFWRFRSAVTMRQTDSLRPVGCQEMYVATYPLRCYAFIRKSSMPCDSNAVEGWVMDMFWKYVSGKDTALRNSLGVTDVFFRPVSVTLNTPDLPNSIEWIHAYFDLDVEVTAKAIESCYDECGVNPIPLPNGQCPPINRVQSVTGLDTDNTDPSNPIVKISVDGITITGEGTPSDPLVAVGGGGGVSVRTQDEGTTIAAVTTTLNFTGGGVTASLASAGNVTVNIPAASGGAVDSVNGQTGDVVLDTDDISDTATNRYTNDTDITRLANTSGTNTGDQDLTGLALKATTISTQSPLTGGGDLSANRTLSIPQANGSTDGYLDSADWNTFNSKFDEPTGTSADYLDGTGTPTPFPSIPSITGLVPYTGATGDVNLGTNGLTAHDLTVSHPSGSGVAVSVTKGGAGEALKVVKSSGSGNAASITGGVTLIDELHLNTDLADTYIASAATWNAKQDPVSAGTGISIASNVITNTAPDQTVALTAGTGIGVTGTYPNFTIDNTINGFIRSEYTALSAASIDVPIPAGYSHHKIKLIDIVAVTINSELWLRVGTGAPSVIQSGASDYTHFRSNFGTSQTFITGGSAADSKILLLGAVMPTGASGRAFSKVLNIYNPDSTTLNKLINGEYVLKTSAGNLNGGTSHSSYNSNTAITSLRLLCSTGNISGKIVIESYL